MFSAEDTFRRKFTQENFAPKLIILVENELFDSELTTKLHIPNMYVLG